MPATGVWGDGSSLDYEVMFEHFKFYSFRVGGGGQQPDSCDTLTHNHHEGNGTPVSHAHVNTCTFNIIHIYTQQ